MAREEQGTGVALGENRRTAPLAYVIVGGLVAGTLGIVFAMTFWAVKSGMSATEVLQSISAGLLGESSFDGGARTALLGLFVHFALAVWAALGYYLVACRRPVLWRRPILFGGLYGIVLYAVMNFLVIPLSAAPVARDPTWIATSIVAHVVLLGIPVALFARQAMLIDPPPARR